ncbi:type I-E CRISPR-associated protein Cas5/CasD [Spirillospora sp. NPDC047279]|uniref:type I-E CRISPR-associated protein Cas5/CasD n=1 Tax=Spirillospora sp. NPDC047279 TaxID=3155478 RepID=UPI0033F60035
MTVLVMQLAGPLQAWGSAARFARRTTESAPTKSGVVGLLASALGRPRTADLTDLATLRFGVRIDQRGTPVRDFQTAHRLGTGDALPVSERFYLADAVFVAAVQGPRDLVAELDHALQHPGFLPYLGRRSCPPSRPIGLGLRDLDLVTTLNTEPWQASGWYRRQHNGALEGLIEVTGQDQPGDRDLAAQGRGRTTNTLRDQPLSFDPDHRRYALRSVRTFPIQLPATATAQPGEHDPTIALRSQ